MNAVEQLRHDDADLLAELQPRLEALTRQRDSLTRKAAEAAAQADQLRAEKTALDADLAHAQRAASELREEVNTLRNKLTLAAGESVTPQKQFERQPAVNSDLFQHPGRFESEMLMADGDDEAYGFEPEAVNEAMRSIHDEAIRVMLQAEVDVAASR